MIERVLNLYPKAFRYVWYHPITGLWCGASPEVLLKTNGDFFKTMALAGTQKHIDNKIIKWNLKEKKEQQMEYFYDEIQTPLLVMVMFFVFQLPIFKKSMDPIFVCKAEVGNVDVEICCNFLASCSYTGNHH